MTVQLWSRTDYSNGDPITLFTTAEIDDETGTVRVTVELFEQMMHDLGFEHVGATG